MRPVLTTPAAAIIANVAGAGISTAQVAEVAAVRLAGRSLDAAERIMVAAARLGPVLSKAAKPVRRVGGVEGILATHRPVVRIALSRPEHVGGIGAASLRRNGCWP